MNYLLTVRRAKFLRLCLLLALLSFALLSPEAQGADTRHAGHTHAAIAHASSTQVGSMRNDDMHTTGTHMGSAHTDGAHTRRTHAGSPHIDGTHADSIQADNPEAPASGTDAATRQRLQQWLQRQPGLPSGNGVQLDIAVLPRTRPARLLPCQRSEFFLPTGTRLWKRINVGERCVAGAGWTTWHAVDIRVHGPALLARQPLPAGSTPQPGDFSIQQVEWTAQPSAPLDIATALGNQELVRALAAGQPLRADHLRALPAIRAGEQVAAVTEGDGFRIAIDAIALASAAEGQSVRVRTASGKVLTGMASGKTVKISR